MVTWVKVPEVSLLLGWLVLAILLPFLISKVFTPIYNDKYTIGASPALYILVALGICRWKRPVAVVSISGLFLLLSLPALNYYYLHPLKEQWREIAVLLEKSAQERDAIVVNSDTGTGLAALEYYYRGEIEPVLLGAQDWELERVGPFLDRTTQDKERLWVVSSHSWDSPVRDMLKDKYRLIQTQEFVGLWPGIPVDLFSLEKK